jgi:ankyrin repeat protein
MNDGDELVEILLTDDRCDVNARDVDGRTPLIWAANVGK